MEQQSERSRIRRFQRGASVVPADDEVAREEPLEIRVAGRGIGVTMRTPGHDQDLALGFLVGEGVLARADDVEHVRRCDRADGERIDVIVSSRVAVNFAHLTRHVFASSSCGVCGSTTIDAIRKKFPQPGPGPRVSSEILYGVADTLRASQPAFDRTGGLHAAGLFAPDGRLQNAREDIGRHNAVDKLVGHALRAGLLPLSSSLLLVSGRASFEIVQKALAAGIPIVAAVSAPSSLAVRLAEESGLTLIGFVRPGRFNLYSHPQRITE